MALAGSGILCYTERNGFLPGESPWAETALERNVFMKILIAEDDPSLRKILVSLLEKSSYRVDAVENGLEALDYLRADSYDGAILDIMMPKMDGLEVLCTVRQEKNTVPVLMLTAKSEIDDKVAGLDQGANDYLTKPFDLRELLARLRVLTRKQAIQHTSLLELGNTGLDTGTYTLSAPGGSYRLANKEYQTMELLMRNPNVLLTPNQFLENIWDPDSRAEDNTVWTYISYLRRKLTAIGSDLQITTRRRAGYLLEKKP